MAYLRGLVMNLDGTCALCETAKVEEPGPGYWLYMTSGNGEERRLGVCLACARETEAVIEMKR